MSFRWTTRIQSAIAVLALAGISIAYGQSTNRGESILFSSPDGQSISNSAVPVALAPEPPKHTAVDSAATESIFNPPSGAPMPLSPGPVVITVDNSQNSTESGREATPAQIMGVQTLKQIFGLPERQQLTLQNPAVSAVGSTNVIYSDGSSMEKPAFGQSDWAKIFAGGTVTNANHSDNAQDLFGGFFNHSSNRGFFGNDEGNSRTADTTFGSERAAPVPPQDAGLNSGLFAGLGNPAAGLSQNNSQDFMNAGINPQAGQPQSPFEVSKSPTVATLPQLPAVQTAPGQSYNPAPAAPPSWAPKPPPWVSSQPVPGTMEQRKF